MERADLEEELRKIQMKVEDFLLESRVPGSDPLHLVWRSIEQLWRNEKHCIHCGYPYVVPHTCEKIY